MSKRAFLVFLVGVFEALPAAGFDPFSRPFEPVELGNRLYGEQHFDQALEEYERAEQQIEGEPRIHFNRGSALFKLGRMREARDAFLRATGADDLGLKKMNYYGIGNTFLSEGAYREAITYYRRALEIDPGYDDARFNLELALRAIQQQQQQQQKDGDSGRQKDSGGEQEKEQDQQSSKDQQQQRDQQDDQQQEQQEQRQQGEQDQEKEEQRGEDEQQRGEEQESQGQDQQDPHQEQQAEAQKNQQQPGQEEQQQTEMGEPPEAGEAKPSGAPERLTKAQIRDLLDAMRENEKPFQMDRFMLPKFQPRSVDKDW